MCDAGRARSWGRSAPAGAVSFADLSADKIPDLFRVRDGYVDDGSDNLFGAYAGNGIGEFVLSLEVRLPYRGQSRLIDVNGDGKPDLKHAEYIVRSPCFGDDVGTASSGRQSLLQY